MLLVPSLNPSMFRGVDCSRVVDEVRPKPSCEYFTATVPNPTRARLRIGVHGHLRVVRARLHADVTAALGGVQDLVGELRQVGQRGRALVGDAEPVLAVLLEERWPEPDRQRQLRTRADPAPHPYHPAAHRDCPRSHRSARHPRPASSARPSWSTARSSAMTSSRLSVVTSNAQKCIRSCCGVMMPAWRSPRNGIGLVQPAEVGAGRGRPARQRTRTRRADDGGRHPRRAEQLAPGQPAARRIRFRRRGFRVTGER